MIVVHLFVGPFPPCVYAIVFSPFYFKSLTGHLLLPFHVASRGQRIHDFEF